MISSYYHLLFLFRVLFGCIGCESPGLGRMSAARDETKELGRTKSSMETDAVAQQSRGSNQRTAPHEHNVQLPDVPYDEVSRMLPSRII